MLRNEQSELSWTFCQYAEILSFYAEADFEIYSVIYEVLATINYNKHQDNVVSISKTLQARKIFKWNVYKSCLSGINNAS